MAFDGIVAELADRIEELYVFPEAGRRIADELRALPIAAGTPEELAAELKPFLRGHDGHLALAWKHAAGKKDGLSADDVENPEYQRRVNYGFRSAGLVADGIGLIDLTLVADADEPAMPAAAAAATVMVAQSDAVILDLRGVPGGWPSGANLITGHFLPAEPVHLLTMTKRGEPGQEDWTPAENELGHRPEVPLFVLVDARSASAAEALAYTLQSLGRATIVGQKTAGAANPGDFFPIGEDFTAFIPTMAPIDPRTGGNWEGVGVLPDVATDPEQALETALALARQTL